MLKITNKRSNFTSHEHEKSIQLHLIRYLQTADSRQQAAGSRQQAAMLGQDKMPDVNFDISNLREQIAIIC
jgi:hypothetical protein